MPNTHTQTNMHLSVTSRNLLARTLYIRAAKLATWGVGPDVCVYTCINTLLGQALASPVNGEFLCFMYAYVVYILLLMD